MKIALLTPWVVGPPLIGGLEIRFYQLQSLLARIAAPAPLLTWDLRAAQPVDLLALPSSRGKEPEIAAYPVRPGWPGLVHDLATQLAHARPGFSARSLAEQERELLGWIEREQPTHVVLVHPYASELIPTLARRGIKVFVDCHNVESELARGLARIASTPRERLHALTLWQVFRRRERIGFAQAREVWLPSVLDIKRQQWISGPSVRYRSIPNALDLEAYSQAGRCATHDLVYPAEFGYRPNLIAAEVLCRRVLPAVQSEFPDARLLLVGRDRFGWAEKLQHEPDIIVTGAVEDTRPYLRAAGVVPVALQQGSGTRYKILEALALGVPVVSTPLGSEGLEARDNEQLLVREIEDFAVAIRELLRNPERGVALAQAGRVLVEQRYSWRAVEGLLRAALES